MSRSCGEDENLKLSYSPRDLNLRAFESKAEQR